MNESLKKSKIGHFLLEELVDGSTGLNTIINISLQ